MKLFSKNLTLAAGVTTLAEAARQCRTVSVHSYDGRCELCHQQVKQAARVAFDATGVELLIGLDCHDTISSIKRYGVFPTSARLRKQTARRKEWARRHVPILASMVAVLRKRAAQMPPAVAEAFRYLETFGHPFSAEEGKSLLDYHRHNDRFWLLRILRHQSPNWRRSLGTVAIMKNVGKLRQTDYFKSVRHGAYVHQYRYDAHRDVLTIKRYTVWWCDANCVNYTDSKHRSLLTITQPIDSDEQIIARMMRNSTLTSQECQRRLDALRSSTNP